MKRGQIQFVAGIFFALMGMASVAFRDSVRPDSDRLSPISDPEQSGMVVEVVGWIGVFGWLLILVGLFFAIKSFYLGFVNGDIEAFIEARLPKPKPEEGEESKPEGED